MRTLGHSSTFISEPTMKAASSITVLAAFAATIHASCYSGGEDWGDQLHALQAAHFACNHRMSGTYGPSGNPGGHRATCVNRNGKKLEFEIWHVLGGVRQLHPDECYSGISSEIINCVHGGDTTYTNWRYRSVLRLSV
jgi:hypothetical protein